MIVEPFAGSLAVLLGRPTPPRTETVNDADCYLSNFWPARVMLDGVEYPSTEHAYQAAKTLDKVTRERIRQIETRALRTARIIAESDDLGAYVEDRAAHPHDLAGEP